MKIRFTRFLRHFWPAISINTCYPSIQSRFANSYAAQLSNGMFPVLWNLTVLEIIEFKCLKNWENAREGHLRRYGTSIPRCPNRTVSPENAREGNWRLYAIFRALIHRLCSLPWKFNHSQFAKRGNQQFYGKAVGYTSRIAFSSN